MRVSPLLLTASPLLHRCFSSQPAQQKAPKAKKKNLQEAEAGVAVGVKNKTALKSSAVPKKTQKAVPTTTSDAATPLIREIVSKPKLKAARKPKKSAAADMYGIQDVLSFLQAQKVTDVRVYNIAAKSIFCDYWVS